MRQIDHGKVISSINLFLKRLQDGKSTETRQSKSLQLLPLRCYKSGPNLNLLRQNSPLGNTLKWGTTLFDHALGTHFESIIFFQLSFLQGAAIRGLFLFRFGDVLELLKGCKENEQFPPKKKMSE